MTDILLVDIGNSRIKWGVQSLSRPWDANIAVASIAHEATPDDAAELVARFAGLAIDLACVSNVAGEARLAAIRSALGAGRAMSPATILLRSSKNWQSLINDYIEPERLGADRWASLIAARVAYPDQSCILVGLGTATTIDWLRADGHFAGGVILPGRALMKRSLARETAQLPEAPGSFQWLAANTEDAIESGVVHAQVGAITRIYEEAVRADAATRCVLTGGNARAIRSHLPFEATLEDNLVLRGLFEFARSLDPKSTVP